MVGLRDVFVVAPAGAFHPAAAEEPLLSTAEHPIIPLIAADYHHDSRACGKSPEGVQLWQPQPPQHQNPNPKPNPWKSTPAVESSGAISVAGGSATCQDCGNQAKKDCTHRRCRTCCKSRGFDCTTHVKSTWVPAARRRERHLAVPGLSASTSATKKPRLISSQTTTTSHTSASNTPPRSFDMSSSHQGKSAMAEADFRENLPGHVRAPAMFKCVKVTSVDNGEDEYAYQALVTIGGHVFKGFLYDQGVDDGRRVDSTSGAFPNISGLHLGAGEVRNGASSSSGVLPSGVYGSAGAGGAAFGNTIN